jgi:FixJ family two-component response regulator
VRKRLSVSAWFSPKLFNDDQFLAAIHSAIERHGRETSSRQETEAIRTRFRLLTEREYEVFRYFIAGLLNKQIAFELKIAEQTVKIHRGRVMQKLAVSSVPDPVGMAGIADIPPARLS